MKITTHVLDTSQGKPASQVPVRLEHEYSGAFRELGRGTTDQDGRLCELSPEQGLEPGTYRLIFDTQSYFERLGVESFYPRVEVSFRVTSIDQHYHVPLLLSPFGYSTYRGS